MNTFDPNSNHTASPSINFDRAAAYETVLSLRFWDKALVPNEITAVLGVQPHIAHPAGVSLSPLAPVPPPFGIWAYWGLDIQASSLENNMLQFLNQFPQDLDIWRSLTTKYSGVLICGLRFDQHHNGEFLSVAALEKITQRGLALDLDLKFDGASF